MDLPPPPSYAVFEELTPPSDAVFEALGPLPDTQGTVLPSRRRRRTTAIGLNRSRRRPPTVLARIGAGASGAWSARKATETAGTGAQVGQSTHRAMKRPVLVSRATPGWVVVSA